MPLSVVQAVNNGAAAVTPNVTAISATSTGNALIVVVRKHAAANRTMVVSDDVEGTTGWTELLPETDVGSQQSTYVFVKPNVPAGITTISVAQSGGSVTSFSVDVLEVSGMGTEITLEASDLLSESVASDNHQASATGVSASVDVLGIVSARLNSSSSGISPGAGWTAILANVSVITQYQVFTGGVTNEVGAYTSSGTDRTGHAVIVLLAGNGGGGGEDPTPTRGLLSFSALEAPNRATKGRLSFAELESPQAPTRGRFSFGELEAPGAPTKGRLSLGELEAPLTPTKGRLSALFLETPTLGTRAQLTFAEFEVPLIPTRARVAFAQLEVGTAPARGRLSQAYIVSPDEGEVLIKPFSSPDKLRTRRRRESARLHH